MRSLSECTQPYPIAHFLSIVIYGRNRSLLIFTSSYLHLTQEFTCELNRVFKQCHIGDICVVLNKWITAVSLIWSLPIPKNNLKRKKKTPKVIVLIQWPIRCLKYSASAFSKFMDTGIFYIAVLRKLKRIDSLYVFHMSSCSNQLIWSGQAQR